MTTELTAIHRALEDRKQALVKDLKSIVGDADDMLREVSDSTAEEFAAVRAKIEAKLSEARYRLHDARITASRKACSAAGATQEYVMDNPWKVLGVAAAVGLLAAVVLNRR